MILNCDLCSAFQCIEIQHPESFQSLMTTKDIVQPQVLC